jgi:outer membrane protein assembly factor BamD
MAFRRIAQNLYPALLAVSICLLTPGCSAVVMDNDSPPEAQYAEGERLLGKDRYIEAVERFRILKSRYPYSKYAALASLRIGDAHYKEEAFLEAASAYKIFRELYPRHEEAAYALFRIAESHYNMLPSTTDRDLEPAQEAIAAYQRLLQDFPLSPQAKEAEARVKELRGKLAEREAYVGNFYFQRELYQASASRYSFLLDNYPEAAKKDECLYRLAFSLERMGEYRKAESALEELNQEFPAGREEGRRLSLRDKVQAGLSGAE